MPRFAEVAAPLTDLLNTNLSYRWTPTTQAAFDALVKLMEKPPKLDRPDPNLPYVLQTDASDRGMGAVLFQIGKDGQRRIISFASAKFKPAETRYHCNEQECLAVIWAIRRYHVYLEDCPFTLRTDSKALTWLDQMKDTKKKLTQWASYLSRLKFTVEHCPGKENELADALSRHPAHDAPSPGEPDLEIMLPHYRRVGMTRTMSFHHA